MEAIRGYAVAGGRVLGCGRGPGRGRAARRDHGGRVPSLGGLGGRGVVRGGGRAGAAAGPTCAGPPAGGRPGRRRRGGGGGGATPSRAPSGRRWPAPARPPE